jgi:GT2 family glycosyltransferase
MEKFNEGRRDRSRSISKGGPYGRSCFNALLWQQLWVKLLRYVLSTDCCPAEGYGPALPIKRDVIERIGFLDDQYFSYMEDIDYSMLVRGRI